MSVQPQRAIAVVVRLLALGFFAWLYGGDLVRRAQAQSAEVAALSELPHLGLALAGVLVALGGFGVLGVALAQRRPARWAPLRLLSSALVALALLDFVVLSSKKGLLTVDEQGQLAIDALAQAASDNSGVEAVLRDPAMLGAMAADLGAAPYFERGEPVGPWRVEVRERCAGPADDAREARPGTLIYCVAADFKHAWVTLVATRAGQVFGARQVVGTAPGWVGEVQVARPPERDSEEAFPPEQPVWDSPTPEAGP